MKRYLIPAIAFSFISLLHAENESFKHLDVALTLGSTGIGVDVATPLFKWLDFRAGASLVPTISLTRNMNILETAPVEGESQSKFDQLSETFETITGYKLNSEVTMESTTHFRNANVMLDFKPFKNKRWHLTAGVYFGSSNIVTAKNTPECMSTLISVGVYNNYCKKLDDPAVVSGEKPFFSFKNIELYLWEGDLYLGDTGVKIAGSDKLISNLQKYGTLGATLGQWSNGESYRMVPDENGVVSATVKVNSVKPYFGFGYEGNLSRKSDKYLINFDCGVMVWGGVPHFYMHDGTDLTYEIQNYNQQISKYCGLLKCLPVYPVANVRFIRRIDFNRH